jgi:hypothetical protein
MLGLQYTIVYRKGAENTAADALSRRPYHTGSVAAISSVQPTWITDVVAGYQSDAKTRAILARLALQAEGFDGFLLRDGIIRKHGRIWLGANLPLQTRITDALHASATGGHSGFSVTYRRIKQLFAWPLMKQSIRKQVQSCLCASRRSRSACDTPDSFNPCQCPITPGK